MTSELQEFDSGRAKSLADDENRTADMKTRLRAAKTDQRTVKIECARSKSVSER